jgi:hypothetical protein
LMRCSCAGTAKYFVPRAHVDFIACGRELYIKTLLLGVALLSFGGWAMSNNSPDQQNTYNSQTGSSYSSGSGDSGVWVLGVSALSVGLLLLVGALIAMIPSTLTIYSNAGTFRSTNCCNTFDTEAILKWLKAPALGEAGSAPDVDGFHPLQTPARNAINYSVQPSLSPQRLIHTLPSDGPHA